jgi:hypothetical protein
MKFLEGSFDAVRYLQILMAGVASWKVCRRLELAHRGHTRTGLELLPT